MQDNVKAWVAAQSQRQLLDPVVEFGALQVEGQVGYADLRPYFIGLTYIGVDLRPGPGVDVVDDMERPHFRDRTMGTVLCLETLEHVKRPWRALAEAYRILKDGGLLLLSVPWDIPIHNYPSDYWRLTPAALELLLEDAGFKELEVTADGPAERPKTVFAIARK